MQYACAAVENVQEYLVKEENKGSKKAATPTTTSYKPGLDVSQELGPKEAAYF